MGSKKISTPANIIPEWDLLNAIAKQESIARHLLENFYWTLHLKNEKYYKPIHKKYL